MAIDDDQPNRRSRREQTRHLFRTIAAVCAVGWFVAAACGVYALRAATGAVEAAPVERINPNTAPTASLMRLPGIGRVRAMDILAGRKAQPFDTAADLERIRGIGPKTVEKIAPYLMFEDSSQRTEDRRLTNFD